MRTLTNKLKNVFQKTLLAFLCFFRSETFLPADIAMAARLFSMLAEIGEQEVFPTSGFVSRKVYHGLQSFSKNLPSGLIYIFPDYEITRFFSTGRNIDIGNTVPGNV